MTIPPDEVREILKPVIEQVVKLVTAQIESADQVKAVLLVGGFGGSRYLLQRLRQSVPKMTEVLQPGYGWSAVVQGALLRGLASLDPKQAKVHLTSRVARKHIGHDCHYEFDGTKHLTSKRCVPIDILNEHKLTLSRWFSVYYGQWRSTVMDWFITKVWCSNRNSSLKRN